MRTSVSYEGYRVEEHLINSRFVEQAFRVKVLLPMCSSDGSERFPVLYSTDADDLFDGLAALTKGLQLHGETPRFILVGIGYENPRAAAVLRWRDFAPPAIRELHRRELEQVARSPLVGDPDVLVTVMQTSGAAEFLRFICEELKPLINSHYATEERNDSYFGYSAGATFGLYSLFSGADAFRRYILGSPGTSYAGSRYAVDMARSALETGVPLNAQVFMSVGDLEEFKCGFGQFDLVTGYFALAKFLRAAQIPDLNLTLRTFPGETHATAWPLAFCHGLKALFGSAVEVPFAPDYLRRA